jgi:CRISPR system Cascade subunit CasE
VLSARAPVDHHGLLEVETSEFAPALAAGDRLAFSLRANPVVTRKDPATGRAQRHDIVMDRLKPLPQAERAAARGTAMADAGRAWLARQGEQHGFRLLDPAAVRVDGYDQIRIARGQGRKAIEISVLDLDGLLEVQSPDAFLPALCQGFGKAKAFGCGLMLIRRART